ncbi:MAG: hypothetical protein IJ244_03965 [Bacteroidaceae bacterium]|nr:hypothetical protein [Bacteroidaceae bacterium]
MNKKVNHLSLTQLSSPQSLQFLMECKALVLNDEKVSTKVATELAVFQTAVDEFDDQLKLMQAYPLTKGLASAKKQMGKSFTALNGIVRAMNIHAPSEAMALSAHKLQLLIKTYQIDVTMNQMALLNLIYNLTTDLSSDSFIADVKLLGLELWVKSLIHEKESFEKLLNDRNATIRLKGTGHLVASRQKAEKAYIEMVEKLNALLITESTTDYDSFVDSLNLKIQYQKQIVIAQNKRAKTLAQNEGEKPSTSDDATAPNAETDNDAPAQDADADVKQVENSQPE